MSKLFKKLIKKYSCKDIFAIIVLIWGLILITLGINHTVSGLVIGITGLYFGGK